MSTGALLLTVAGVLVAAGLVGVVWAVRGVRVFPERAGTDSAPSRQWGARQWGALGVGAVVMLLTQWPVAAIGAAAAAWFVPSMLGGGRAAKERIERAEALAAWTRRMADLLVSGAASSTRQAIAKSAASAPPAIAGELDRLQTRMGPQGVEHALRQFGDELADPVGDRIAGVLVLRERNGGPGLVDVLLALAADLDYQVRMLREIEAERAKPRGNMRTILAVTAAALVGMVLFMRSFLSVYSTPIGQVLLLVALAVFAIALRWMRNLAEPPKTVRLLSDPVRAGTQ